jgi:hypothetical protein
MRLPNPLKYFLFRLLIPVALYVLVVIGGTVAFLCIAPVFGYLGYSDRPGPGWFGHFPAITWSEFRDNALFFLDWATLFIRHSLLFGLLIVLLARGLELVRTPSIAVAIICAVVSVFLTGYLMLAAGWIIALGAVPFYFSLLLALLFGAILLPKRRAPRPADA